LYRPGDTAGTKSRVSRTGGRVLRRPCISPYHSALDALSPRRRCARAVSARAHAPAAGAAAFAGDTRAVTFYPGHGGGAPRGKIGGGRNTALRAGEQSAERQARAAARIDSGRDLQREYDDALGG